MRTVPMDIPPPDSHLPVTVQYHAINSSAVRISGLYFLASVLWIVVTSYWLSLIHNPVELLRLHSASCLSLVMVSTGLLYRYLSRRQGGQIAENPDTPNFQSAEIPLLHSEATTAALLNAIPDMIFRIRRDGVFLDFKEAKDFHPVLPPEAFLGKAIADFFPATIAQLAMQKIQQTLATGDVQIHTYQLLEQGILRDYESRMVPCGKDEVLAIVRDITNQQAALREQQQTEAALRHSEEQRRLTLEFTHIGSWDWNIQTGELLWNDNHFRLLGLSPGSTEVSYQTWRNRVHPQDIDRVEQAVAHALETHTDFEAEYRVIYPDRTIHWLLGRGRGIYDEDGKVARMIGVIIDVSRLKQVEADLLASEARFQAFMDNSPTASWITDTQGQILYLNQTYFSMFQVPGREILGKNLLEVYPPAVARKFMDDNLTVAQTGQLLETTEVTPRPDGTLGYFLVYKFLLPSTPDQPLVGGVAIDMTDWKQAEDALRESEERYRSLVLATSQAVWLTDAEGNAKAVTSTWQTITGQNDADQKGNGWLNTLHPDDRERVWQVWRQAVTDQIPYEAEYRILNTQGEERCIVARAVPVRSPDGQVREWIGTSTDITDRKRAEEKLRFQAQLLDNVRESVVATDLEGRIIYWGRGAEALYGYPAEEVMGTFVSFIVDSEEQSQEEERIRQVLELGYWKGEYQQRRRDGTSFWADTVISLAKDEQGKPFGLIGIDRDISAAKRNEIIRRQAEAELRRLNEELEQRVQTRTQELHQANNQLQAEIRERQRTEVALRQSEELFRQIFESAPVGIALANTQDYQFRMVNPLFCTMLGYSEEELMAGSCPSISHPEDADAEKPYAERLFRGDIPGYQFVKRYIKKNQEIMWGSLTTRAIRNQTGEILYILGIVEDITERKQIEDEREQAREALARRTAELDSLINIMPDYIYVIERNTMRILLCNQAFVEGIGRRDRQAVQGKLVSECFSEADTAYFYQQNQQVFDSGQTLHVQETIVLGDEPHHFETFKIPVRQSNGEIYALLGMSRDYTELIETQRTLSERTAQLEASNQELNAFSYSVSHDLRAPLRHISGFVNALRNHLAQTSSLNDPKVAHYLQVIQDSSFKMGQLIDGLLTLSRVGRRQMAELPVDLNLVVQAVLERLSESPLVTGDSQSPSQPVEFVIGALPAVMGDATLLQQVFANLLENAIKFSRGRSPARVEVGTLADGTLFVRDNGVGFSMEYADQLFGAFQRLHPASEFEGTGIGLAIVQRIIHRHGGMIWAESKVGHGATFYFKFKENIKS